MFKINQGEDLALSTGIAISGKKPCAAQLQAPLLPAEPRKVSMQTVRLKGFLQM